MQIPILGLSNISEDLLDKAANLLNSDFSNLRFYVKGRVEIPSSAYNKFREQYMAERILDNFRDDGMQILITNEEIYGKGTNYVFGESEYRGPMVLSIERLKPEFYDEEPNSSLLLERLEKEIIHELGHCFGLKHCENRGCVMQYSNSIKAVDKKNKEFCEECQVEISTQGLELD